MFGLFLDDDVINLLVSETQKYNQFENCSKFAVNSLDMRCIVAIPILRGYNAMPGKRFFWDTACDIDIELLNIVRDRFLFIFRYFNYLM